MDKPTELLEKLMHSITTIHQDISGNHKYALSFESHKILSEINAYLNTHHGDVNTPDACDGCEHNLGKKVICGLPSLTPCIKDGGKLK